MTEFIHALTGSRMWVDNSRESEYLAAGHKLAADTLEGPPIVEPTEKPIKEPVEQPTKKKKKAKK